MATPRSRRPLRLALLTLAAVAAFTSVVVGARHLDPVPEGLRVQYFSNADPDGSAELTAIDREPSTEDLSIDWSGRPPQSFTAVWSGWLVVSGDGAYRFGVKADRASELDIDGQKVVDDAIAPAAQPVTGEVHLGKGAHAIFVRYRHDGGAPLFHVLWSRANAPLAPLGSEFVRTRQISYSRFETDRVLDDGELLACALLIVALVWAGAEAARPAIASARARLIGDAWPALLVIVGASLALNLAGITWGLPSGDWVGDELGPFFVLDAVGHRFAHGWFTIYPPLHYYVLALAYLPALAADWLGFISLHGTSGHGLMAISGRLVSVAMAAGIVVAIFVAGRLTFGARAGLFAAALFALGAPFVYYAKTANVEVPYLFWLSICLVFYLRVLTGGGMADFVAWSVTGTLAVCTKDQVYAFCGGMAIVVIVFGLRRGSLDRRIVAAAAAAAITFATVQNVAFNAAGVLKHFATVTSLGGGSSYQMFDATLRGRLSLAALTAHLTEITWGWPVTLVCVLGTLWVFADRETRRPALWLAIPAVAYYFGFTNVVLYNYDRFVLPICLVLALFGGVALDRLTASCVSFRAWRLVGTGAVFAYTLLYAATVDVLMLRDSRYSVERWLDARAGAADVIGTIGIPRYLPRLDDRSTVDIDRIETLDDARPRFAVVNADYTRSEDASSRMGEVLRALRNGRASYRLALEARTPSPWPWLPGGHPDLTGDRRDPRATSFLRNINPAIEVFERR